MGIKVEGLANFKRKFDTFPLHVAGGIQKALDKSAEEIRARAAAIAPRSPGGGELAKAIEVKRTLEGFNAGGSVGRAILSGSTGGGGLTRYIGVFPEKSGAAGWYAAFVEFGTAKRAAGKKYTQASGRKRTSGNTHPGTPARPFLRPAFFSLQARSVNRVKRAINKAAKGMARG